MADEEVPTIENEGCRKLVEALKTRLESQLQKGDAPFGEDDLEGMISELTEGLTDIPDDEEQIPLSFMGLEAFGDSLAFALLDSLKETKITVVKLGLRGIALTPNCCEALTNWIAENDSVLKLDLSDNGFGVEGLTKLVDGLSRNHTLQILALECVEAGDEGAKVISSWLENAKGELQTVNLSGNDIGEEGAEALLKALRGNNRITDLRLKSNKGISEGTLQKLQTLTEGNKAVRKIVSTLVDSIPEASRSRKEKEEEAKELEELAAIQAQRRRGAQVKVKLNVKEMDAASAEWDKIYPRHPSKRFKIGWAEMQGRRPDMQDSTVIWGGFRDRANEDLICVFDGHGTEQVAVHCAKNLPDALKRRLDNNEALPEALRSTFLEVDEQVKPWAQHTGTTAAVAFVQDRTLYLANAGDTRAVLYRNGVATRLTVDHKASVPEEKARIEALGGAVVNGRVRGMIQVSRAIGDAFVQPHLTPEPYLSVTHLESTDKFLIVACDGIWDIFSDEAACEMISKETNAQSCALKLRDQAYRLGSNDNISVIVLRFDAGDSPLFTGGVPVATSASETTPSTPSAASETSSTSAPSLSSDFQSPSQSSPSSAVTTSTTTETANVKDTPSTSETSQVSATNASASPLAEAQVSATPALDATAPATVATTTASATSGDDNSSNGNPPSSPDNDPDFPTPLTLTPPTPKPFFSFIKCHL